MAVRKNIGGLASSIRQGMKASYYSIPSFMKDPSLFNVYYSSGDWFNTETYKDAFMMGIHRWGDTRKKVYRSKS